MCGHFVTCSCTCVAEVNNGSTWYQRGQQEAASKDYCIKVLFRTIDSVLNAPLPVCLEAPSAISVNFFY